MEEHRTLEVHIRVRPSNMKQIALNVAIIPLRVSNAYLVGSKALWYLVDAGLPGETKTIHKGVKARFGEGARPAAIVLTHGHPDHVGSAQALADEWGVKVYAARLELPYLSGLSQYPPRDPTAPGFLAAISRFFPETSTNLGDRLAQLNEADPFPGLTGWETIDTPGHSPGHVSYFRKSDGLLLAGDAFANADFDSPVGFFLRTRKVSRPAASMTMNWQLARDSVVKLARLHPTLLAAGHGQPIFDTQEQLQSLADTFSIPAHGRYVQAPAKTGDKGIISLPPAPTDLVPPVTRSVVVAALALGIGAGYPLLKKKLKKSK